MQTWTRDLRYHPHVHYLIPGGGLSEEAGRWLPAKRKFLLPEKPLAKIFRAKFRDRLKKARLFHLVPGGGMSAEAGTWLPAKRKYLLPEKPLAWISTLGN